MSTIPDALVWVMRGNFWAVCPARYLVYRWVVSRRIKDEDATACAIDQKLVSILDCLCGFARGQDGWDAALAGQDGPM